MLVMEKENMNIKQSKHDYSEENAKSMGKVRDVRIDKADNGWVIKSSVKEMSPGKSMSDHMDWMSKEMVFLTEKEDEAFEYFKALKKKETPGYSF